MTNTKILLQSDKCLVMQPELIKIAGKSAALLLQQIHYWIINKKVQGKIHNQKKWIANSYEAWAHDLKIISRSTIGRSISTLKSLGILFVEKLSTFKNNRTNWYTINYDRIAEILSIKFLDNSIKKETFSNATDEQNHIDEEVKMSLCSTQNEPIYIDKKTNKEIPINLIKSKDDCFVKNEDKTLTQQMIDIWNKIVKPDVISELTKNRCKFLIAAFKYKFNNDITKWKNYCHKITTSDYLMGRIKNGFKIALDTSLKFDFIQRVFEKHFGIKDIDIYTETKDSISQEINNLNSSDEIKNIHHKIYEKFGTIKYTSWFKGVEIINSLSFIDIFTSNTFKKNWITNNYKRELEFLFGKKINILVK